MPVPHDILIGGGDDQGQAAEPTKVEVAGEVVYRFRVLWDTGKGGYFSMPPDEEWNRLMQMPGLNAEWKGAC